MWRLVVAQKEPFTMLKKTAPLTAAADRQVVIWTWLFRTPKAERPAYGPHLPCNAAAPREI